MKNFLKLVLLTVTLVVIHKVSNGQSHSDTLKVKSAYTIDSLKYAIFNLQNLVYELKYRTDMLEYRVIVLEDSLKELKLDWFVDSKIMNQAGVNLMTGAGSAISAVLLVYAGNGFYSIGFKEYGYAFYGVAGGFGILTGIQIYITGEKMSWLGKKYRIVR